MSSTIRKRSDLTLEQVRDVASRTKVHTFGEKHIRAISEAGVVWVPLIDILHALDYTAKPSHIAKRLREGEVELKEIWAKSALVNCVNRRGLYSFALYANDVHAMNLYRWAKKRFVERGCNHG